MLLTILSLFWFVSFTDKSNDAHLALGERAIAQREKWSIEVDSLDYSVSPSYLDGLRQHGARVCHTSRWMNGATIEADSAAIKQIKALPYVKDAELTKNNECNNPYFITKRKKKGQEVIQIDVTKPQLDLYNLSPLHQIGYKGQGIHLAVIDGGFQNIHSLSCFDSIRSRLTTYDFADSDCQFDGQDGAHGSMCLSIIAGQVTIDLTPYLHTEDDTVYHALYEGAAPQATFYAIRTEEEETESPKELDNLVAAIELCDSLGINIISSSLGYSEFDDTTFNYSYSDMDGATIRCSRACGIAADKGMLCVIAMGNEGAKAWHYLTAPADANNILATGAVDIKGTIASFSSRGPSSDGRIKPDACAVGQGTILMNPGQECEYQPGNGTSFACPLVAGLATALWSALPNENAMQIRERIIRSADRYQTPDDDYGYGIPDAMKAYTMTIPSHIGSIVSTPTRGVFYQNGKIVIMRDGVKYSLLGVRL